MQWFTVQPRSKLREENRKSEKSFGVPTTSGILLVAVLEKRALMNSFFNIVISIWPILAVGLDYFILRRFGGFDRNTPRINEIRKKNVFQAHTEQPM